MNTNFVYIITNKTNIMYRKKEPKDKNITVRVTTKEDNEFNARVKKNGTSRSELGHKLLFKNKNNYRRSDRLVYDIELEDTKRALIHRILKKFQIKNKKQDTQVTIEDIKQLKLAIKILDMTTFHSNEAIDELILIYRLSVKCYVHRSLL